jgi:glycosyltransferase involved in cell wall biosynthesis
MSGSLNQLEQGVPSVTVLMAVFNGTNWLSAAIESVIHQTFKDFEFIIVDDGSTDDSSEIMERYQKKDSRIIIIRKPNTGLADSLNQGIHKARGMWIARLDADDICETTRLEKQIELTLTNSKIVFVGTGLTIINEDGEKLATYQYPKMHVSLLKGLIYYNKFPAHSSAFYKTEAVRELGGYRSRIKRAEDLDLWLRLSEKGEFSSLTIPLIQLRHHSKQISNDESGQRQLFDSRMAIVSYWIRYLGGTDPIDTKEIVFNSFVSWLKCRLVRDRFFEFHEYSILIRFHWHNVPYSFINRPKLLFNLLKQPGFLLRFAKERIFGDQLLRKLALEWIKQGN